MHFYYCSLLQNNDIYLSQLFCLHIRAGHIPFDIIFQRYLPRVVIKKMISGNEMFKFVISARDDYYRDESDCYDQWLLNPNWTVHPSIAFINGNCPTILTCYDHNHGTKKHMIHTCRSPDHVLPQPFSDQLCHAVIQSRTVRPVQAKKYSTSFQMHEQRGTFNGIDTCSITNFGQFDMTSLLNAQSEARTIRNRPDINALLNQLVSQKKMSKFVANGRRKECKDITDGVNYNPYIYGSTFVPFETAIDIQREIQMADNKIQVIIDQRPNGEPDQTIQIRPSWPSILYPCQKSNEFGFMFPTIPKMTVNRNSDLNSYSSMRIWQVIAILSRTECLWKIICKIPQFHRSKWHGWLLTYISHQCFPFAKSRQDSKDPFKKQYIGKVADIINKTNVTSDMSFPQIFHGISSVLCLDDIEDVTVKLNSQIHEIIIVQQEYETADGEDLPLGFHMDESNINYELRSIIITKDKVREQNWDSTIYSRHGGTVCTKWWSQKRNDHLAHQVNTIPNDVPFDSPIPTVYVYVRITPLDIHSLSSEYFTYIGGQKHAICETHRLPLITTSNRKKNVHVGGMNTLPVHLLIVHAVFAKDVQIHLITIQSI